MSKPEANGVSESSKNAHGRIGGFLRRLRESVTGNVAMLYALALVPTVGAAGAAVDLGQALVVRQRLGEATDAAALALGSMPNLTLAQQQAKALEYINANIPQSALGSTASVTVSAGENTVTVRATANVDTAFMGLMGVNYLEVAAETEVTRESRGMEIVMSLDNTGSMSGAKLAALKTSMQSMINILFGNNSTPEKLKMGLVPFSETVRLDTTSALNGGWIDTAGTSQWARLHFSNNMHPWSVWASMHNNSPKWAGCVEARPNGLEELDTPPDVAQPDTRWVPFFQPDEPDSGGYGQNYVNDGMPNGTTAINRMRNSAKYAGRNTNRPNEDCSMQRILPLTNNKATLLSYVNGMQASGFTHIAMGAAWGWRVLSPAAPYTQGAAFGDPDWQKVMVLMTDGVNTIPTNNREFRSEYTAYGYLSEARLGTTNGGQAEAAQNTRTALVCQRMKDQGIRIYTILLMENNNTVRNLMRNCATTPEMFFDTPSAAQLEGTFQAIANELSNLRLSK